MEERPRPVPRCSDGYCGKRARDEPAPRGAAMRTATAETRELHAEDAWWTSQSCDVRTGIGPDKKRRKDRGHPAEWSDDQARCERRPAAPRISGASMTRTPDGGCSTASTIACTTWASLTG